MIINSDDTDYGDLGVNVDYRGALRGRCSSCGCDGYDGGLEKKKCIGCGHPPGKHANLSTPSSSSSGMTSVRSPIVSISSSSKCQSQFDCQMEVEFDSKTDDQKVCYQEVCKLPGCNLPRYVEPGGKMHDFCGITHAWLYEQKYGNRIYTEMQKNFIFLYASKLHRFLSICSVKHPAAQSKSILMARVATLITVQSTVKTME